MLVLGKKQIKAAILSNYQKAASRM